MLVEDHDSQALVPNALGPHRGLDRSRRRLGHHGSGDERGVGRRGGTGSGRGTGGTRHDNVIDGRANDNVDDHRIAGATRTRPGGDSVHPCPRAATTGHHADGRRAFGSSGRSKGLDIEGGCHGAATVSPNHRQEPWVMRQFSFPAMGTEVVAVIETADDCRVQALFRHVERRCSRFLAASELSEINGDERASIDVSPDLAEVLWLGAEMRDRTGGLVDIGLGRALRKWGYDRTFAEVSDVEREPVLASSDQWNVQGTRVWKPAGVEFDLGGLAKGWACDLAVERGLASLVSAGGDLRSATPDAEVEVIDPWGRIVATVNLGVAALATSSVTRRRWKAGTVDAHHILDPRTLAPVVGPVLSATVTAATAVEAEAGAKAVLLHGERGLAWADDQEWLTGALVVWHDGSVFGTTGLEMAA